MGALTCGWPASNTAAGPAWFADDTFPSVDLQLQGIKGAGFPVAAMYQRQPSYAGRNEHNIQQEEFHCSFRYAHSSSRGMRPTMEDAVCMRLDLPGLPNSAFFGVFDGHAGADAAGYASQVIITQFIQKMQPSGRFGSGRSTRGRSAVISSWPPVLDDPYNIHIARTLTQAFCDTDLQIADKFVKSKKVRSVCVRVRACVLRARVRCGLPRRLGGLAVVING